MIWDPDEEKIERAMWQTDRNLMVAALIGMAIVICWVGLFIFEVAR